MIVEAIKKLVEAKNLTEPEMVGCFDEIMSGVATPAQIGSFLTALRIKGETEEEILGAARVMRAKSAKVLGAEDAVDTCGTGGDGSGTFNISTTAAIIAAGAGVKIAKHGNRAASSKCGSADVLTGLGVKADLDPDAVSRCIREAGIGFMFAPVMHAAMKHAIGPRREIGVRTVFNVLGPLTNPAGASKQIMGVFSASLTGVLARVLGRLGAKRAIVVHGSDGLDEITLTGSTKVAEFADGKTIEYEIHPSKYGLKICSSDDLKGSDIETNVKIVREILDGAKGPKRDVALLNAAVAIMLGGKANDIESGVEVAAATIDSGKAKATLQKLIACSNS